MATNYEKLGSMVRKLRKEKGLSQETFAEAIGRDARTVVAIETGKRNPTLKTLNKIAQVLKTPLSELLKF
jgi:transcriptional regulator with XRE-family HTH domain